MAKLVVGQENNQDVELYFEDLGAGPAVVLVHGWPLSGRSFEKQVSFLIEHGYRVITYDRRGFGKSSQPLSGYDYYTLTGDLHKLLEALDVKEAVLVGFSMGGGEVAKYAAKHPERLRGIVFAAAVTPYLYISEDNPDGGVDDALAEKFVKGITTDRAAFLESFLDDFYSTETGLTGRAKLLVSDAQKSYMLNIALNASPAGTLACVESFAKTDFREDLQAITLPALVIHGSGDQVVPFEASGERTAPVLDAKLHLIDGGPHGINDTHAEEFNYALLEFLEGLNDLEAPLAVSATFEERKENLPVDADTAGRGNLDGHSVSTSTLPGALPVGAADTRFMP